MGSSSLAVKRVGLHQFEEPLFGRREEHVEGLDLRVEAPLLELGEHPFRVVLVVGRADVVRPGREPLHVGAQVAGVGDGAELRLPLALRACAVIGESAERAGVRRKCKLGAEERKHDLFHGCNYFSVAFCGTALSRRPVIFSVAYDARRRRRVCHRSDGAATGRSRPCGSTPTRGRGIDQSRRSLRGLSVRFHQIRIRLRTPRGYVFASCSLSPYRGELSRHATMRGMPPTLRQAWTD